MGTSSGSSKFDFQAYGRTPAPSDTVPVFGGGSPLPGGCDLLDSAICSLRSFGGSADRTYCDGPRIARTGARPTAAFWREFNFQGLWPLLPSQAYIFPRPVLGEIMVNLKILRRRY